MPITAQSADGSTHEFPDGTDGTVIDRVMKEYAQSRQPPLTGIQRMGDLLGQGAQQVERGVSELGSDAPAGVMRHGQPVGMRVRPGIGDIVGGASTMVGAPAGLISPSVERGTGIPKEMTEAVAPMLVPLAGYAGGRGIASLVPKAIGAAPRAEASLGEFASKMREPKGAATSAAAEVIKDIKYRASFEPPSKREDAIRSEIKSILFDPKKRESFNSEQIEKMESLVRGGTFQHLLRGLEDLVSKSALGEGVGHLAGTVTGVRPLDRYLTNRQIRSLEESLRTGGDTVGLGAVDQSQPLMRSVIERGRTGRPLKTNPLYATAKGGPDEILEKAAASQVKPWELYRPDRQYPPSDRKYDRAAMKEAVMSFGGMPQSYADQIVDQAIKMIERHGSKRNAVQKTYMGQFEKPYQAAIWAAYDE